MIIVFRVDSSDIIGTGHVYRCLNLAAQYKEHSIYFICKDHPYNLNDKVKKTYSLLELSHGNANDITLDMNTWLGETEIDDAKKTISLLKRNNISVDCLVIDHYAINKEWENYLRSYVNKIAVIDDFTNRNHDCDILINQQITHEEGIIRYKNRLPTECNICCGNDYLLLHPRYFEYTGFKKQYDKPFLTRINIFMGGADTFNITEKIIDICNKYNNSLKNKIWFDVIIGKANKNVYRIKDIVSNIENFKLYYDMEFIGDLLEKSDLAIGAPGSTSYERCLMKTPSLAICLADNQKTVLDKFIDANVMKYLGTIQDNFEEQLLFYLEYFNNNIDELQKMSYNCEKLIDLKNNKKKYILNI